MFVGFILFPINNTVLLFVCNMILLSNAVTWYFFCKHGNIDGSWFAFNIKTNYTTDIGWLKRKAFQFMKDIRSRFLMKQRCFLKPGFHLRRKHKRNDNRSYFTVKTASTQANVQAHCILMLVLVLAARTSTRIKICPFCVLALVLASLVKTRLKKKWPYISQNWKAFF